MTEPSASQPSKSRTTRLPNASSYNTSKPRVVMPGAAGQSHSQSQGQRQKPRVVQYAKPDVRRTKEYKSLARKWTSTIVAVPILLVTSYMLYQRVFHDKERRAFPGTNGPPAGYTPPSTNSPPPTNPADKV